MTAPLPQINALVTDELIEKAAQALHDHRSMECSALHEVGQPLRNTIYANERRADACAVLEAVAPLIAARAWDQGYAASEQEWEHAYDGHTVEPGDMTGMCIECGQGNPYGRKDEQ